MEQQNTVLDVVLMGTEELLLKDGKLLNELSAYINNLIVQDFEGLVSLLYRLDINEKKLKYLLSVDAGINASDTIAALIIERQVQKIKSRRENRRDDNDIFADEAW